MSNNGSSSSDSGSESDRRSAVTVPPEWPFNFDQCLDAIQGLSVPDELDSYTARCSVVRGIRRNYDFAVTPEVADAATIYAEIARARNARLIMSNQIPSAGQLEDPDHVPYCIWHPDVATEETYREIAQRYPALRYQVGRACAVAGYAALYRDLQLRPDVSIAEEARESSAPASREIYDLIMASPARHAIMHDLTRSIRPHIEAPAFLNGDTAVCCLLQTRYTLPRLRYKEAFPLLPDIEEDRGLNEEQAEIPDEWHYLTYEESTLLWKPLPLDLPTIKKDLLIQMAAWEGNVDRYARLMRPGEMSKTELWCVVRGIFHHTMFARWWADQLKTNKERITVRTMGPKEVVRYITHAINARRVMINDIGDFNNDTTGLPWMIWWPLKPNDNSLEYLAKKCPRMTHQIAIACIMCNYEGTYRGLQAEPHYHLWLAAQQSPNPFFLKDVMARGAEAGIDVTSQQNHPGSGMTEDWLAWDLEPTIDYWSSPLAPWLMDDSGQVVGTYFETQPTSAAIERYVFQRPEDLRILEEVYGGSWIGPLQGIGKDESSPEDLQ